MIITFSISNEDDTARPCSNDLSIECESKYIENISTTGHTSIELIADSNTHGDQSNKEKIATRRNGKSYYLNNPEWYRIGACSYYNVYVPKESKSKGSGKHTLIVFYQMPFILLLKLLMGPIFEANIGLLFSKFFI